LGRAKILKAAATRTALAGLACRARATTKDHGAGGTIEFGDGHHDGRFNGHKAAARGAPVGQRLKLQGMGCKIGNIELGEHLFGRLGIVVGRPTHEREASEGHHGIDRDLVLIHEEGLDGGPGIEAHGKGRHHREALGL